VLVKKHISVIMYENPRGPLPLLYSSADARAGEHWHYAKQLSWAATMVSLHFGDWV